MADTAAFLVDRVLPVVPVRQWVLSLPIALRYKLAYDSKFAAKVLDLFVRSVFASLRQRARARYGRGRYECGSVTFLQRAGDAINLNPHFHAIVLDGVFDYSAPDTPQFKYLPPPTDAEVERTLRRIVGRLRRLLVRLGLTPDADADAADSLPQDEPLLAEIYAASVRSRTAIGERAGRGMIRIGEFVDPEEATYVTGPRCASIDGVSLHANVAVPAKDRRRLEKLCRYVARPPLSTQRLSRLEDGRLLYRLKKKWRDGTTHVIFHGLELVEKLIAIVPPPRVHLVRYHGVLGPRATSRPEIVGARRRPRRRAKAEATTDEEKACAHRPRDRMPWAKLMQRVFEHPINCIPRRGSDGACPDHTPVPSAVRAGDRLRGTPVQLG